jgi:hypothetical protein
MKTRFPLACTLTALAVVPLRANLIKNGDFEAGPSDKTEYNFKETPGWYNRANAKDPNAQNAAARKKQGAQYTAVANDSTNEEGLPQKTWFNQKTAHTIKAGDVFNLSLDWSDAQSWESGDLLRVTVYATENDKLSGRVVWQSTVDFQKGPGSTLASETHAFEPADENAAGRTLFFSFYGVDPEQAGTTGFARVDNIVLTVNQN